MSLAHLLALEALILPRPLPTDLVKQRSGFMIALMVPQDRAYDVARSGGWRGEKETWKGPLHFTVSYIPKGPGRMEAARRAAEKAARAFPPLEMVTTRAGFFLPSEKEPKLVHYVGGAAPDLDAFVGRLRSELDALAVPHDLNFPIFVPHCTIEYVEEPSEYEMLNRLRSSLGEVPVRFVPELAVVDDDKRVEVPWSTERAGASWERGRTSVLAAEPEMDDDLILLETIALFEDEPEVGKSSLHKHMVRAIYLSRRKKGAPAKDAATGAFKIANSSMRSSGFQGAGDAGRLTGRGAVRSKLHAAEPSGVVAKKSADFHAVKKVATT